MPKSITNLEPWLETELRAVLKNMPDVAMGPGAIQRERRELDQLIDRAISADFVEHTVSGLLDQPEVRLRAYRPKRGSDAQAVQSPLPALLWMHGGAWSLGGPEFDEHMLQRVADAANIIAVAVDYRLAPEYPYPAALFDCHAVFQSMQSDRTTQLSELGIDHTCIGIGGASAGANLAAGLCLKLRDEGQPKPAFQLLLYPALDDRLVTVSMTTMADPRTLTREFMREAWRAYLGVRNEARDSSYAVPARAETLANLPPTLIVAAELDPLRDEAVHYANQLWQAGCSCELHVLRGAIHGFDALVPDAPMAKTMLTVIVDNLKRELRAAGDRPMSSGS